MQLGLLQTEKKKKTKKKKQVLVYFKVNGPNKSLKNFQRIDKQY